ncbi:hypothetical protein ACTXT7_005265 [Hymenolepis weldensis]
MFDVQFDHRHTLASYLLVHFPLISSLPLLSLTLLNPHRGLFNTLRPTQPIVFHYLELLFGSSYIILPNTFKVSELFQILTKLDTT